MRSYSLSDKQKQYIREADARWNLKVGAVRSGKSFVDIAHVILDRIISVADQPGLNVIMGVSKETVERNVLQPMRELYTDSIVGNINSRNIAIICGQQVYCLGAEKASQVSKIQGSSIKYCYGDEVAKWNKEVFYMLQSRLDKPYSKFDGSFNPESPGHWLKEFIDREDLDAYLQNYTIFDNPFLAPEFVANLCKEYEGTVYYKRYILGEWALAEGLIYPKYAEALQEVPDGLTAADYALSIDYGTMNAFAALLWARFNTATGPVWWLTDMFYYSGRDTGIQKTDAEYGDDLDKLVRDIMVKRERATREDGEAFRKMKTYIDPSAASFIALLRKKTWYRVIEADNAVLDGIMETQRAIYLGRIKVRPTCKEWIKEAEGYIWDEKAIEDTPVKVNDHCLAGDTLVLTEDGYKRISDLVGTSGRVWSYNVATGEPELKKYRDCRITAPDAQLLRIAFEDGRVLRCTGEHPILTDHGYVLAKNLKPGDEIVEVYDGSGLYQKQSGI